MVFPMLTHGKWRIQTPNKQLLCHARAEYQSALQMLTGATELENNQTWDTNNRKKVTDPNQQI